MSRRGRTDFEEVFRDVMKYYRIDLGSRQSRSVIQDREALRYELERLDKSQKLQPIMEELLDTRAADNILGKTINPPRTFGTPKKVTQISTRKQRAPQRQTLIPKGQTVYKTKYGRRAIKIIVPSRSGKAQERYVDERTHQPIPKSEIIQDQHR